MQQRLISLAFRNVMVNWRHSLSALLSVVAAFYSIVFFEGYIRDVGDLYYDGYHSRNMFGDFVVENAKAQTPEGRAEPFQYAVTADEQKAMKEFTAKNSDIVEESARFLALQGMVTNGKTSVIFFAKAMDIEESKKMREPVWGWNALYGKPLHLTNNPNAILVGQILGRSLSCHTKPVQIMSPDQGYIAEERPFDCDSPQVQMSVTTESGQLNAMDFDIAGFVDGGYQEIDNRFIMMSLPAAQQLMNTDKVSYVTFLMKDQKYRHEFEKRFNEQIGSKYPDLRLTRWQDHPVGELYRKSIDLLSVFRNFVVIIIISITTLSVANTKIKSIKERTKEIGTLRSLGFSPGFIRNIFMWESFFLSAMGIIIGAVAALVTSFIVNHAGIYYKAGLLSMPVPFHIKAALIVYIVAAAVLISIGLVVTALVCRGTLRKKIVENLGHV
ncbi:ABC transporter permease [Bdellovibrio sp. NC01]|uniref:ABC transporter permease n=1 Tax=Bdellovibrio sp. NC01 TaxID=2220073 RepID=UPI00115B9C8B|nr:FtsX-like permease family protein [Bdellovibrio sp. NC01]QDK39022.1 hypothetical protein DOE51_16225 [Bdellovibrio sp. NC01]